MEKINISIKLNHNNMATTALKFKTSLNCSACVSKVQPELDKASGISSWKVDTTNPDKILTVESNGIASDEVVKILKGKGFTAEAI